MSDNRFVQTFAALSATTIVAFVLCLWAIPIAQIAIGAIYLHDCPRQHYIPIYLIVTGVFGIFLSCLPATQKQQGGNPASTSWYSLISLFLFCWFIAGNVWIYSIYEPNYNKNTTDISTYCNKTVYLFAFWTTNLVYILLGVVIFCGCCCCFCCFCFGCFVSGNQEHDVSNV